MKLRLPHACHQTLGDVLGFFLHGRGLVKIDPEFFMVQKDVDILWMIAKSCTSGKRWLSHDFVWVSMSGAGVRNYPLSVKIA